MKVPARIRKSQILSLVLDLAGLLAVLTLIYVAIRVAP